jgi:catechol 2,3-dioxygenase-like lactoylglutathione lyase family enzyme
MRMPRVVGIDHLVLSVSDFRRSKAFYDEVLGFLGFKRKYDYADMAGWSNGKTLFWIAAASPGRRRRYRKGDVGFHHYAFELSSRADVDALGAFLKENRLTILDPPGEYYDRNYYAVYFADPDGMKLEGMIWAPREVKQEAAKEAPLTVQFNPSRPTLTGHARRPRCGRGVWRHKARGPRLRPDRRQVVGFPAPAKPPRR